MTNTICYISTIEKDVDQIELNNLSQFVCKRNDELRITGVLIILNGHFFQILEGEEAVIENIFKKIKSDHRHFGLIKLLETKIDCPLFTDYESGHFKIIKDFSNLKKLKLYFNWIREANILAADNLIKLTENFLKYNT